MPGTTATIVELARSSAPTAHQSEWAALVEAAVLDTLAVALAARDNVLSAAATPTGHGPCTVWTTGIRTDVRSAAFENALAAHWLDFDDTCEHLRGHLSGILVPVLMAGIDGSSETSSAKRLVNAYATGARVAAALAAGMDVDAHYARGWHATCTVGGVAAAAALSHLLELSVDQTRAAIGLAATTSAGMREGFGTDAKPLQVGAAAESAVRAVQLAVRGARVGRDLLDGPFGYFALLGGGSDPQYLAESLMSEPPPGQLRASVKLFPCCYELQRTCAVARRIRGRVDPASIVEVKLVLNRGATQPLIAPWPESVQQARFSPRFAVAHMLAHGEFNLSSFTDEAVNDQSLRRLGLMVDVEEAAAPPFGTSTNAFACLEIRMSDGRTAREIVDVPPGHASQPIPVRELSEKTRDCLASVGAKWHADSLEEAVNRLVHAGDATAVHTVLSEIARR